MQIKQLFLEYNTSFLFQVLEIRLVLG